MSTHRPIETAPDDRRVLLFGDARLIGTPVDQVEADRQWVIGRWQAVADGDLAPGYWQTDSGESWVVAALYWADLPEVPVAA